MQKRPLALLIAALLTPATGSADEVLFKNGDRLTGKIVAMTEGELEIESTIAGSVKIPMSQVATFASDEATEIHFEDGTVVNQVVATGDPGSIHLAPGGLLQVQAFPVDQIDAINPPPPPGPEWDGNVLAAVTIDTGNTEKSSAYGEFNLERRSESDRINFSGRYRADRETDNDTGNSSTSERYWNLGSKYDYFLTERWYAYAKVFTEQDATADLDLRMIAGPGAGYYWFKTEELEVAFEAGLNWMSESFSDNTPDDDFLAARVGFTLEKKLGGQIKLFQYSQWLPSLEDSDNMLIKTETGFRADLTDHVFAEAKVLWDWDSAPAQDADREDVSYIMGLGWDF